MFALGVLLIQSGELDLEHILFGDIWSVKQNMLWFLRIWAVVVLTVLVILWRPLWACVMDSRFARGLGYRTNRIDLLFLVLTAVSVVGMIQSVGVVLVAAYLVLPAASMLPWARSLKALALGSIVFAALASMTGVLVSFRAGLSAGPSIAAVGFVLVSLSHALKHVFSKTH
jgi:zinc/manganese transport system permease protein